MSQPEQQDQQPPPAVAKQGGRPGHRWWWRRSSSETSGQTRNGTRRRRNPSPSAGRQEQLIVEALSDLRDMDVREVMTPRVDVATLTIPVRAEDVVRVVRETGHSCFPVVHDDLDDLVGVLYVNDLFRTGRPAGPVALPQSSPLDISRRIRQPLVLPESLGVLDALADMRRQHRAFAVVVDEYGGVAGVLTVKDLLEPLVGDLHDEFDTDEEADIVRVDASRWLIDGRVSVDDVRERLAIDLPDGEYVTLGGYLFDGFGHIPSDGESLRRGDWELRVAEMDKRRVAKVVARHLEGLAVQPARNGDSPGGPSSAPERDPGEAPQPTLTDHGPSEASPPATSPKGTPAGRG